MHPLLLLLLLLTGCVAAVAVCLHVWDPAEVQDMLGNCLYSEFIMAKGRAVKGSPYLADAPRTDAAAATALTGQKRPL